MIRLFVPTKAWAAFAWCALATVRDDFSPILGFVRLDYTPATETAAPTLTMLATDRHRVHRVIVPLPADEQDEGETAAWSVLIPASVVAEAAKHPTVGKARYMPLLPVTVPDFGGRIEAGYEGWGSSFPIDPGNFPPVDRLIPDAPGEVEQGPIMLRMQYLADLAKYRLGGRRHIDETLWTLTWTAPSSSGKPGPVFAYREDDGIQAAALIQPNIRLR